MSEPPPLKLDHLVVAVRDLDVATQTYVRLLARKPSWRGRHPAYGTANVLFRLDNTYVELLAPQEEAGGARVPRPATRDPGSSWRQALLDHLVSVGEGLYAIALGSGDIDAAVAAARAAGLNVADPLEGEGVDLDTGARRQWRNARIDPASTRGVRAFFIEHLSPFDALPIAPPVIDGGYVTGVDHVVIASSHIDSTLAVWHEALGIDLRRTLDWSPERRLCFLKLGDIVLELAGSPVSGEPTQSESRQHEEHRTSDQQLATSDVLWGVSYRSDNVAALVERLRREQITVSDARAGRADNTVVADLKPGFSHDVRTLFIQKEPVAS